ncbi:PucR family transcriptional regulator [Paenibacillus aquistagni]|uniref:PucR C-terminal helix-turn-helix domain-containing protein n=1 Tax=Paenibacillus aquistagni TaxID=1852522 RepID=A0A1X7L3B3_9BACL|nr:helix-turn-helix domain-containing protein [Paenibacillus aquistagni]SMG47964.1 PucR C-terminal helix-turn-helix domain-containing protein [Paenibacillus aquistagni]
MEKQLLREQIERIIQEKLETTTIPTDTWKQWLAEANEQEGENLISRQGSHVILREGRCYLLWRQNASQATVLFCNESDLSERDIEWLRMLLWMDSQTVKGVSQSVTGDEYQAALFGQWILERLQASDMQAEVPDSFSWKNKLFSTVIPFLLVTEQSHREGPSYTQLYKLLKSYFGGDLVVVPLTDKEWFFLVPEHLTSNADADEEEDNKETIEEYLTSYCHGLFELLAPQWIGESHLSVAYPTAPIHGIPAIVSRLRETIYLGRTFHIPESIHLPWELHLEHLVYSIPDEVRKQFMQRVVTKNDNFTDVETMTTLQTFFQYNCSVSETAKRLYIHRNTLLYRLDKIKQETGLDVRTFSDAVLVKLILLLYKVTK